MNLENVKRQAIAELKKEDFEKLVQKYKQKLREKRKFWARLFPYRIIIIKKEE